MCHGKLFDRDFSFSDPLLNLRFLGAFQPKLDGFLYHRFGVLWSFPLTDDPKFRTIRDVPSVVARFNDRGELGKFHKRRLSQSSVTCQSRAWRDGRIAEQGRNADGGLQIAEQRAARGLTER